MAPAAQVQRSERKNRGEIKCGEQRDEKERVSHSLSFFLFFSCDGCKVVDHPPDLSVFLIKILYLKAHRGEKKPLSKQSVCERRGKERPSHSVTRRGDPIFKYSVMHWKSVDFIRA